ncbi:hypothetical protein FRC09_002252 [Ceratobasidium sp. 395]|nr:hypothetical protein FRC09_002252 [Ceratobasidium sp. 395]
MFVTDILSATIQTVRHTFTRAWGGIWSRSGLRFGQSGDANGSSISEQDWLLAFASIVFPLIDSIDVSSEEGAELMKQCGQALEQFMDIAQPEQLDLMIQFCTEAKSRAPEGHSSGTTLLNNLALLHQARYKRQGCIDDLDTAIQYITRVLEVLPNEYPGRSTVLNNMASLCSARFNRFGELAHLDQAVDLMNQSIALTPETDPSRPALLSNLGVLNHTRFEALGAPADLERAAQNHKLALSLVPDEDSSRLGMLSNLGLTAESAFRHNGELTDLDLAISCLSQAASLLPDGSAKIPTILNNLGMAYHTRYDRLAETTDLELAIEHYLRAVKLTNFDQPDDLKRCGNLGLAYCSRFEHSKNTTDLTIALEYLRQAASRTPEGHPSRSTRLSNLGFGYKALFEQQGDVTSLENAIECLEQAVLLTPEGHPDLVIRACNLGDAYLSRFEAQKQATDLDHAVEKLSQSVRLTPDDHPDKPMRLTTLADAYERHYQHIKNWDSLEASIECIKQAAQCRVGLPRTRLSAARTWALLSMLHKIGSPLDGYQRFMDLIPEVIWLGLHTEKRYEVIPFVSSSVIEAANTAIQHQKPETALEWLESGRSIVWTQLLELRTPLDNLAQIDKGLAEQLKYVSASLELLSSRETTQLESNSRPITLEETAQQHRRLAEQREDLIKQARLLPNMGEFLKLKTFDLASAARGGAVVVFNVHKRGCHALIIRPHDTVVSSLNLQNFTHNKAADAHRELKRWLKSRGRATRGIHKQSREEASISKILYMLWVDLVEPVLEFLGYTELPLKILPHITWCATGPLSFLPLHAAGDYGKPGRALFNFAISSFTPTIGALLTFSVDPTPFSGILAVGQAKTPGYEPLPFATAELDNISASVGERFVTRLEGDAATVTSTLAALSKHSWVHFACHASQDVGKPTASAIYLYDGPLDLATITREHLPHADLAFLSACQTATGDETLSEESVHLAAGMLMAGFKRVIATMWAINDEDAPLVVKSFYAYMLDTTIPNDRKAAKALHHAIGSLRDKIGVNEYQRWASYVHIGL